MSGNLTAVREVSGRGEFNMLSAGKCWGMSHCLNSGHPVAVWCRLETRIMAFDGYERTAVKHRATTYDNG